MTTTTSNKTLDLGDRIVTVSAEGIASVVVPGKVEGVEVRGMFPLSALSADSLARTAAARPDAAAVILTSGPTVAVTASQRDAIDAAIADLRRPALLIDGVSVKVSPARRSPSGELGCPDLSFACVASVDGHDWHATIINLGDADGTQTINHADAGLPDRVARAMYAACQGRIA